MWEQEGWNLVLDMKLVESSVGLRSLHMQINHSAHSMEVPPYRELENPASKFRFYQTRHLESVHRLARLPLTDVEVYVAPRTDQHWYGVAVKTPADRKKYAEWIWKLLLDPKGAEKFTQEPNKLWDYYL